MAWSGPIESHAVDEGEVLRDQGIGCGCCVREAVGADHGCVYRALCSGALVSGRAMRSCHALDPGDTRPQPRGAD
jgi:hypothetical protein